MYNHYSQVWELLVPLSSFILQSINEKINIVICFKLRKLVPGSNFRLIEVFQRTFFTDFSMNNTLANFRFIAPSWGIGSSGEFKQDQVLHHS